VARKVARKHQAVRDKVKKAAADKDKRAAANKDNRAANRVAANKAGKKVVSRTAN
jgi:hypothetical protein